MFYVRSQCYFPRLNDWSKNSILLRTELSDSHGHNVYTLMTFFLYIFQCRIFRFFLFICSSSVILKWWSKQWLQGWLIFVLAYLPFAGRGPTWKKFIFLTTTSAISPNLARTLAFLLKTRENGEKNHYSVGNHSKLLPSIAENLFDARKKFRQSVECRSSRDGVLVRF